MASKPPLVGLDRPEVSPSYRTTPSSNLEDVSTSLLDMPDEIIIHIFQFLSDPTLRSTLHVCRRTCRLALAVTLSRHQTSGSGSDPAHLMLSCDADSTSGPSTILGISLSLAPFLPPLNRITCQFPDYPNTESVHRQIKILHGIILHTSLSHLESFEMDLSKIGSLMDTLIVPARFLVDYRMWWGRLLIPLLSDVVGKAGTVTVRYGYGYGYGNSLSHAPQYDWTRPSLVTRLRWLGAAAAAALACTKRATHHDHATEPDANHTSICRRPGTTTVHAMNIHSAMLLHPPFLPWTIDTLNSSSITNLSFDHIDLGSTTWGLVLQILTLPALLELSFEYVAITLPDISRFLARHPLITKFHLSRPTQSQAEIDAETPLRPLGRRILPRLITLSLSPSLEHFKVFLSRTGALPSLHHLCLIKDISVDDVFVLEDIDAALSTISTSHRLDAIDVSLRLNLICVCNSSQSQWFHHTRTTLDSCASSVLLASVAHMEIKGDLANLEDDAWVRLPSWLTLFRALREIVFVDIEYSVPSQGSSRDGRLSFLRSLHETCPAVETVGFNEEVHTVTTWLIEP